MIKRWSRCVFLVFQPASHEYPRYISTIPPLYPIGPYPTRLLLESPGPFPTGPWGSHEMPWDDRNEKRTVPLFHLSGPLLSSSARQRVAHSEPLRYPRVRRATRSQKHTQKHELFQLAFQIDPHTKHDNMGILGEATWNPNWINSGGSLASIPDFCWLKDA